MRCRFAVLLTALIVLFTINSSTSQEIPALSFDFETSDLLHQFSNYTGKSIAVPEKSSDLNISYANQLKKGIHDLYTDRLMLFSFAAAGLFANTNIDERLRSSYYGNIKSSGTNSISRIVKPFGNGRIMIPSYIFGFLLGKTFNNSSLEEWSKNVFNATLISVPGLLASQYSLGGSRPHMEMGSKWWTDMDRTNGASGHTLVSAIPFITSAKMTSNKYLKILLYSASTFTGISRINDDAHYASQVLLGYAWAYCAANSVLQNMGNENLSVNVGQSGIGFSVSF